jgi:hypothetical protein
MTYVIPPGGIKGVIGESIGVNTQMWPPQASGTTLLPQTSWIYGDTQFSKGCNQLILWPIFTQGPATTACKVKIEFSYAEVGPWFQEPSYIEATDATKTYLGTTRVLASGINTPLAIPFIGDYVRVAAQVTGTASGSLLGIIGTIASAM